MDIIDDYDDDFDDDSQPWAFGEGKGKKAEEPIQLIGEKRKEEKPKQGALASVFDDLDFDSDKDKQKQLHKPEIA